MTRRVMVARFVAAADVSEGSQRNGVLDNDEAAVEKRNSHRTAERKKAALADVPERAASLLSG